MARKTDLEAAVSQIASQDLAGSGHLVAKCLKAVDALNATMVLYQEVGRLGHLSDC